MTEPGALREQMLVLIEQLEPVVHTGLPFRRCRADDPNFRRWCEEHPAAAARRFRIRFDPMRGPAVTNGDVELRELVLELLVAYPQTSRFGAGDGPALDRDDAMRSDQLQLEAVVGHFGARNFTGDGRLAAAWLSGPTTRIVGRGVDFLRIRQTMRLPRGRR